ncbi:hypothetical protein HYDPIDRAFT_23025 [Hydnomerulius pinastri MD-312]|nr:hypothetical protein HYDPIDRAFT_23025 [Hydnomerulius pinastri MD-312]
MESTLQEPLVIPSIKRHTATIIFLHSVGDTGNGWREVAESFSPAIPHLKWVLPHAPTQIITANPHIPMPAWYDTSSFVLGTALARGEDEEGMIWAARELDALIQAEIDAGVREERILIGGFSQGAVVALIAGLTMLGQEEGSTRRGRNLAGVAILSGYLPLKKKFKAALSENASNTPIFWGQGIDDPLVPEEFGSSAVKELTTSCAIPLVENITIEANEGEPMSPLSSLTHSSIGLFGIPGISFRTYKGLSHMVCTQELKDMKTFLARAVPETFI